jgi:hypothetical protein
MSSAPFPDLSKAKGDMSALDAMLRDFVGKLSKVDAARLCGTGDEYEDEYGLWEPYLTGVSASHKPVAEVLEPMILQHLLRAPKLQGSSGRFVSREEFARLKPRQDKGFGWFCCRKCLAMWPSGSARVGYRQQCKSHTREEDHVFPTVMWLNTGTTPASSVRPLVHHRCELCEYCQEQTRRGCHAEMCCSVAAELRAARRPGSR